MKRMIIASDVTGLENELSSFFSTYRQGYWVVTFFNDENEVATYRIQKSRTYFYLEYHLSYILEDGRQVSGGHYTQKLDLAQAASQINHLLSVGGQLDKYTGR